MRYQLKEKVWSWTDAYRILDATGHEALSVHGKFFSWGKDLTVLDAHGNEVARIKQKLMSLLPRFQLYRNEQMFAEIIKEFSWFKSKFTLDVPGPNDYEISGDFWDYEYEFKRRGRVVASVSKAFWAWGDTYGVDIINGEDDISILSTVVVIDLVCHEDKSND